MSAQGNLSINVSLPREASLLASDSNELRRDQGKVPTDPVWVRESLEAYSMFQDQEEAYGRYPALDKKGGKDPVAEKVVRSYCRGVL